jgi:isopenicillin N synthase-like dioxygenase
MEDPPLKNRNDEEQFATDVPVIDLLHTDHDTIVQQIAEACSTAGFFHVLHHGIDPQLIAQFRAQCRSYFTELDPSIREQYRRNEGNARGFFDNELTKQRRDWKYALDVGVPGSRNWQLADDDPSNGGLDGFNQLPTDHELPGFRATIIEYFEACAALAHRLTILMTEGLQWKYATSVSEEVLERLGAEIVEDLQKHHTSYLRLNYYPPCPEEVSVVEANLHKGTPPLGISPHRDAGFLTVLLQDDDCYSLQVPSWKSGRDTTEWRTVVPIPGALTINTGDMAQIWSNGIYTAPLHRVLTHPDQGRYSAPFFYNPGYKTWIRPLVLATTPNGTVPYPEANGDTATDDDDVRTVRYHPCLWGYFRAVRFAGDLTNLGVEIQVEDFLVATRPSKHLAKQNVFAEQARVEEPFSVERFRHLLVDESSEA